MKNFKKVVALVLAFAMVLSMGTVAFAAEETSGDKLYELNLMQGYSLTEKDLGLEDAATAAAAMKLIGEALGWDVDEDATVTFTDVPDWAVKYVAYAVENGITNGVSATEFGTEVDGKRMVTWVLRALGYDATEAWEDTDTLAATAGIVVPTADATRGVVADVIYDTLDATPVDGTATVIETLVAADPALEAKAAEYGLVTVAPEALAVESVTMANLKEVVVTFNMPLEAAKAVVANFAVTGNTVTAITADGASYTLMLEAAEGVQTDVEVVAKTGTGLAAESKTTVPAVMDLTVPVLETVTLTGPKTFDLTFSEPVNGAPTVLVNNGVYGASVGTPNGRVVTVTLATTLTDGDYTLSVKNATDFANWKMADTATTLPYVKDASTLTVSVVEATQTYVVVEFNKVPKATPAAADFYHTYSAWTATTVSAVTGSTTQFKVEFENGKYVIPGTTNLVVSDDNVEDQWGNKMAADAVLPITVAIDQTAPEVVSVTVKTESQVEVLFTEDVLGADTAANFEIKDADAAAAGGTISPTYVAADKKVTLDFTKLAGGNYTLTVKNITDNTPQANKITEVGLPFTITDMTAPVPVGSEFTGQIAYVTFNEAMGADALVVTNWVHNGEAPKTAEFFNGDAKKIKLTFEDGDTVDANPIYFGRISDAAGNTVTALSTTVTNAALEAPSFTAKSIGTQKVELVFAATLTEGQTVASNYTVSGSAVAVVESWSVADNKTTVVVQTPASVTFAAATVGIDVTVAGIKADTGIAVTTAAIATTDGIAPTYVSATTNGATSVALTFDENLDAAVATYVVNDLVVKVADTTLVAGVDYTTTISGAVVTIETTASFAGKTVSVDTVDAPVYIKDAAGNKAAAIGDAITY